MALLPIGAFVSVAWFHAYLEEKSVAGVNAMNAAMDRRAEENERTCEICLGTAVYLCPTCRTPIATHSHEHDYLCDTHGFVDPIRQHDGVAINGGGWA